MPDLDKIREKFMFCFQCEQTGGGKGCTTKGICGKDPATAALQDLLVYAAKGIAQYAHRARKLGAADREIDVFVIEALFSTITNVNFDPDRVVQLLRRAGEVRDKAKALYEGAADQSPEQLEGPAAVDLSGDLDALVTLGVKHGIELQLSALGPDVTGLQELITYGLKGAAAYADHAQVLGAESDEVYAGFNEVLDYLAGNPADVGELTATALKVGDINLKAMELLDKANTDTYGHPEPTQVRITPVQGKCILVSGHDFKDLDALLKQTEGKGINVYTHGEMLPGLAYPGLKKFKHLAGNYGGPWQEQKTEFDAFPGAILMTTNCIQEPKQGYQDRIFTTGLVAWPGVKHLPNGDFASVIEAALAAPGFAEDAPEETITIGFARNAVLGVADKVIEAVKGGAIKHFFLIGGCDGARKGRNYFTELAEQVPDDCVIMTLGCGKYRFNKLDFGDIGGIPRLLDLGQCNDSYSAIQIAVALADAFDCGVNDLPLSIVLSWFEQKAVAVLLSLLNLGIKNIRLGPTLPAFVTPAVLDVLVENFDIKPTATAEEDMQSILAPVS